MTRSDHLSVLVLLAAGVAAAVGVNGWARLVVVVAALVALVPVLPDVLGTAPADRSPLADALDHLPGAGRG